MDPMAKLPVQKLKKTYTEVCPQTFTTIQSSLFHRTEVIFKFNRFDCILWSKLYFSSLQGNAISIYQRNVCNKVLCELSEC